VKLIKSGIFLLLLSSSLFAQNVYKLDLKESINLALKQNYDLAKVKLEFEKAKELVSEAYGTSLFPSIDGSINYNRALKQGLIFIETPFFSGSFPAGTKNTLTGSVTLEQPLFTGAMFLAVRIAKTFAEISEKNLVNTKLQTVAAVKEVYYNNLLAIELVELSEINLKLAKENLDNTQSMYNAGLIPDYDLLKAKVNYQNLIPALTESKSQKQLAENSLKILIGLELEDKVELTDSLYFHDKEIPLFSDAESMLVNQNPLLSQLKLDTELKDLTASYRFSEHFPKINLNGTWQMQAQENDTKSFSRWPFVNSVFVGLTLRVPIFKGFSIDSQYEQAKLDHKISLEELAKMDKTLRNQLNNTILNIKASKEKVGAYKLALEQSKQGYDISVKRFNAGLGTQLEVTNALVDFTLANINYNTTLRDYFVYHAQLESLLGTFENN